MAGLEDVESSPHVAFAEPHKAFGCFLLDLDVFIFDDVVDERSDIRLFEGTESKPCTSGKKGGGELVGVIGNDAEASVGGVLFHDPS